MGLSFWADDGVGYDGPLYSSSPWDYVMLGNDKLPGICRVRGAPEYMVDRQKPNGGDAAAIILRGYNPKDIEIEVTIWTPQQWEKLQDVITKVWRRPNKASALDLPRSGKGVETVKKAEETAAIQGGARLVEQQAVDISHPSTSLYGIKQVVVVGMSMPEDGGTVGSKVVRIRCVQFIAPAAAKDATAARKTKGSKAKLTDPKVRKEIGEKNSPFKPPSASDGGPKGPPTPGSSGSS